MGWRETMPTTDVGVKEGRYTLIIATSSYVNPDNEMYIHNNALK